MWRRSLLSPSILQQLPQPARRSAKAFKCGAAVLRTARCSATAETQSASGRAHLAAVRRFFAEYRRLMEIYPYRVGFASCFCIGSSADVLVQTFSDRTKPLNKGRVLSTAFFCGFFSGCAYHFFFNVVFTRLFGAGAGLRTSLVKVAADSFGVFPFVYLPTFYVFDGFLNLGEVSLSSIRERWLRSIHDAMRNYLQMWPAANFVAFKLIPVELRIPFLSFVSFCWVVILSATAHGE
eukprot:TRINITY_DN39470_c0_g1_i1.p1 TRINITY_DN39470_c0_g1~~TRINITY_DN39470_c0_g1_i1.p1  ORF type:complete len:236 (-),score=43.15 TRINITY_DN39470_c0_g1_i1:270-977(-)